MKRFALTILLACTVFALLIFSSVLIGRAQERPDFLSYLGRCDGLPCYVGIVPGQTLWADVQARFEIITELRGDNEIYLSYAPPGFSGTLRFYPSGSGSIREVDLRFHTTRLTLGDLVAEMGEPCAVAMTRGLPAVLFPGMGVLVIGERIDAVQSLKPSSTVTSINLVDAEICDIRNSLALYGWRGFGRYVS